MYDLRRLLMCLSRLGGRGLLDAMVSLTLGEEELLCSCLLVLAQYDQDEFFVWSPDLLVVSPCVLCTTTTTQKESLVTRHVHILPRKKLYHY